MSVTDAICWTLGVAPRSALHVDRVNSLTEVTPPSDVRDPCVPWRTIAALVAGALVAPVIPAVGGSSGSGAETTEYLVLLEEGADRAAARAAVEQAGGTVVKENANLGTMTVRASASGFAGAVSASSAVAGAARNRPVGKVPDATPVRPDAIEQENLGAARSGTAAKAAPVVARS